MGEAQSDRIGLLQALANMDPHPESVPVNLLVKIEGTPLEDSEDLDVFEYIRCIAVARILMPKSLVRLSAGRQSLSDEAQAMCFFAGANSIFYGDRLLTTDNPEADYDHRLFTRIGLAAMQPDIAGTAGTPEKASAAGRDRQAAP
jgi:biotin synthase